MQTMMPRLTTPHEGSVAAQSAQVLFAGFAWILARMSCEGGWEGVMWESVMWRCDTGRVKEVGTALYLGSVPPSPPPTLPLSLPPSLTWEVVRVGGAGAFSCVSRPVRIAMVIFSSHSWRSTSLCAWKLRGRERGREGERERDGRGGGEQEVQREL